MSHFQLWLKLCKRIWKRNISTGEATKKGWDINLEYGKPLRRFDLLERAFKRKIITSSYFLYKHINVEKRGENFMKQFQNIFWWEQIEFLLTSSKRFFCFNKRSIFLAFYATWNVFLGRNYPHETLKMKKENFLGNEAA